MVKKVNGATARGRPKKPLNSAANEAAQIIELALMLKQGRIAQIQSAGFTRASALRYVLKRRRGLVGAYIGTTVTDMLIPTDNRTQAALRLITEHEFHVTTAARIMKLDRRTLTRMVKSARQKAASVRARTETFSGSTEVRDLAPRSTQDDNRVTTSIYLPENPPA